MSDILEYIEILNSGLGTLDATKDMVIITDYNPQTPVIRPPYIAENIANKKNDLSNPNITGYTSTLAVYNAIQQATSGLTANWNTLINRPVWLTGTTIYNFQTGHTHNYNLLNNLPTLFTGNTFVQSGGTIISKLGNIVTIYSPTGGTISYNFIESGATKIQQFNNNVVIYSPSGSSTSYNFIESGSTQIKVDGNNITIYSPSGTTGNYVDYDVFNTYTGTTVPNNYYNKTQVNLLVSGATSGLTSNWDGITNKPSWLSGTTLNDFESGHTHSQYYLTSDFSNYSAVTISYINYISGVTDQKLNIITFNTYTGTTVPNNYYNKTIIDNYTGNTGAYEFITYAASDLITDLATTTTAASFPVPFNCTLLEVFAALDTVASGATVVVDVYYSGSTIFGANQINIESGEYSSLTATNQPTLNVINWTKGVKLTTLITQTGASIKGKGLIILLKVKRT